MSLLTALAEAFISNDHCDSTVANIRALLAAHNEDFTNEETDEPLTLEVTE